MLDKMPSPNDAKTALLQQLRKSSQTIQGFRSKLLGLLPFPSGTKAVENLRNWYQRRQNTTSTPVEETRTPEVIQNSDERIAAEVTLPTSLQTDMPDIVERTSDSSTIQIEEQIHTLSTRQEMMADMGVSKQAGQADTIEQARNTPPTQTEEQVDTLSIVQEITTETNLPTKKKRATKRTSTSETIEQTGNNGIEILSKWH